MRILIFEPLSTGHHPQYLGHMLRSLRELEQEAIVVTRQQAVESPSFQLHLADVRDATQYDTSVPPAISGTIREAIAQARQLQLAIERHRPDHVWVPYADHLTEVLSTRACSMRKVQWPEGVEAEGLYFRGRFAYPVEHWSKHLTRAISRWLIPHANWNILHMLDPIAFEKLKRECTDLAGRLRLMPDPVEEVTQIDRLEARSRLSIPSAGRYLGCFGVLTSRKGIDYVLPAFRQAQLSETDRLLLAGPIGPSIRSLIEQDYGDLLRQERIVMIDRYLNVDELMLAVMAVDVVCTPYPFQIGSASFVIRAAAAQRPLLASDFGWQGWAVPRFQLGATVRVRDIEAFAAAVRKSLDESGMAAPSAMAERFIQYHSPQNFQAHWTARLRERLHLPPDDRIIPWPSAFHAASAPASP